MTEQDEGIEATEDEMSEGVPRPPDEAERPPTDREEKAVTKYTAVSDRGRNVRGSAEASGRGAARGAYAG